MNKRISYIISELEEIKLILKKAEKSDEFSLIELDVLKLKFQKMYEALLTINSKEVKDEMINSAVEKPLLEAEKILQNPIPRESSLIEIETTIKETKPAEVKEEIQVKKAKTIHEEPKGHIIADKYAKDQKFINEVIAAQKKDFSSILQSKPISSIEAAVGINEKFLFIHDLFNGDSETYKKTISILNSSANFNEAFNYIHNTFSWDMNSEAAQKLLDLVRRRFIVDNE